MGDQTAVTKVTDDVLSALAQGLDEVGYYVVPGIVAKDRLEDFNRLVLEAYEESPKFRGGGSLMGHLNCYPGESARFIYETLELSGVVDAVLAACPELRRKLRPTMNFNLPGSRPQHYHMDGVYTEDYVICNVAVVDIRVDNGAIDILPGTHRQFYPFWRYAVARKYRLSTRVALSQGDVLLRRSTLWHRGMPNRTSLPRPMFSLNVGEKYVPDGDPFNRGGADFEFYANWYPANRLGALRERTEAILPVSRSAVRFAKSLIGNRGYSSY